MEKAKGAVKGEVKEEGGVEEEGRVTEEGVVKEERGVKKEDVFVQPSPSKNGGVIVVTHCPLVGLAQAFKAADTPSSPTTTITTPTKHMRKKQ